MTTSAPAYQLATRLLHAGRDAADPGVTGQPIQQAAAFEFASAEAMEAVFAGREPGYVYTRIGNPTVAALERRLTALEGGRGTVAVASGMAAITAAVLAVAGAGDELITSPGIFGGTHSLFTRTLPRYGITVRTLDLRDPRALAAAIRPNTRLIFAETIANPGLDVLDLAAVAAVAAAAGVALVVDNTVATPVLVRPGDYEAALVVHSVSKYLAGHGTTIAGSLTDTGRFDWGGARYPLLADFHRRARGLALLAALRSQIGRDLGACLAPLNAFLAGVGLETLALRVERHNANALQLAQFLAGAVGEAAVRYPGLPSHPDHALARRQFGGSFGPLVTVRLGSRERAFRFINALRLARVMAHIGDSRTLVVHPASTFAREFTAPERQAMGVSDDLVRFAVGIEHAGDIVDDVRGALAAALTTASPALGAAG